MMKKLHRINAVMMMMLFMGSVLVQAQDPTIVSVRDLNTYDIELTSQADLPGHPLTGSLVQFDAVVVSYPKNSGLGNISSAGVPNRIHVFVADVNAVNDGLDGMFMHIVDPGTTRQDMESLTLGDVIRVQGNHTFFGNTVQFTPTDVEFLGNVFFDPEYEGLEVLLEPTEIPLSELNMAAGDGLHQWNSANYSKYINRYVRIKGLEVIARLEADAGRPWFVASDGTTILTTNDTSLRFRNDRTNYAYNPETGVGLDYNWRRLEIDGPYVPPPAGAVIDYSGFVVVNPFNPAGFELTAAQSTLKLMYWDDGIIWTQDGTDEQFRITEGVRNDLVILGFAPVLGDLVQVPAADQEVFPDDEVSISVTIDLPEDDYTFESVTVTYTAGDADPVTEDMDVAGNLYSFTFPAFAAFTMVDYQVVAEAKTPENVSVFGRASGSFYVLSETQTAPPLFSPAPGSYNDQVTVSLTSMSSGANIFYTTDGTTPDDESAAYTAPLVLNETTVINAIAFAPGFEPSPVASGTFEVIQSAIEYNNLAAISSGLQDGTNYLYTGQAIVTYARGARNQKYLMDASGGILIDDNPGVIVTPYAIGDVMTGLLGNLGAFNQQVQFNPGIDPGTPVLTGQEVTPVSITLAELDYDVHESMLVRIENVTFQNTGTFAINTNYNLVDESLDDGVTVIFRSPFGEANYIGQPIPTEPINLVALVNGFNRTPQLASRSLADMSPYTSLRPDGTPDEFRLAQNYPNPFNPTTNIHYSLAEAADVTLTVYDILGRRVATLVSESQMSGQYTVNFDATRLASGTYIYRLEAGSFTSVKKMMLIK